MHKRQAKDTFSSEKIVHRVLSTVFVDFIQDYLAPVSPVAPCGQRPGVRRGVGGSVRRKAPSIFLALTGFNAVNWRLEEWGERERGHIVLLHLFVCLSSHCGNQFAFCRTVDKERKRLPGGLAHRKQQQRQAEIKPPHQNTQLCGTSSSMTTGFYLIKWE